MNTRDYLRFLAASPVGLGTMALSVAAGAASGASLGAAAGLGIGAASLVGLGLAATLTGLGPRAAARERERRDWARAREALAAAKAARGRLATLRVPDAEVQALAMLAATRGQAYLAACESARTQDPRATYALEECVELVDLYLRELDGASTEKRYGLADADPFADAKARTLAALRDRIAVVESAVAGLRGPAPSQLMETKEIL